MSWLGCLAFAASTARAQSAAVEPTPGVSNVVFMLAKADFSDAYIQQLSMQEKCTARALGSEVPFDTVVFYEKALLEEELLAIAKALPTAQFVDAREYGAFSVPDIPGDMLSRLSPAALGYRNMCRFHSMLWYKALAKYEFAMRADDDVCLEALESNPFVTMREKGYVYAYGAEVPEGHMETVDTMDLWLDTYTTPRSLPHVTVENIFFTNFFVSSVQWWSSTEVQRFLAAVDGSGNTYTHRWGDAPIQTSALKLHAAPEQILDLHATYVHLSTWNYFREGKESPFNEGAVELKQENAYEFVSHFRRMLYNVTGVWTNSSNMTNMTNVTTSAPTPAPTRAPTPAPTFKAQVRRGARFRARLAGQLADFTDAKKSKIKRAVARLAGAHVENVTLTFKEVTADETRRRLAGQVEMSAEIESDDLSTVSNNLAAIEPSTLKDAVEEEGLTLEVLTLTEVSICEDAACYYHPPSPPSAPRYEPDDDAGEHDLDHTETVAVSASVVAGVTLVAMLILAIAKRRPFHCTPVPKKSLQGAMVGWGDFSVKFYFAVVPIILITYVVVGAIGFARLEIDTGSQKEWSPIGGRLEAQIDYVNKHLDDSITDRSYAYVIIKRGGNNMLGGEGYPEGYVKESLSILYNVLLDLKKSSYIDIERFESPPPPPGTPPAASPPPGMPPKSSPPNSPPSPSSPPGRASVQERPVNDNGEYLVGLDEVCLTLDHPFVRPFLEGAERIPCINPSPLDGFVESMWQMDSANISFDPIDRVRAVTELLGYPGQLVDPMSKPSFHDLTDAEIIQRLSYNISHWLYSGTQNMGKLYGGMKTDANGLLTFADSFVVTLYNDIPAEAVKGIVARGVNDFTPEKMRDGMFEWMLECEKQCERMDGDDETYPGVEVLYYPSNALERMYSDISEASWAPLLLGYLFMLILVCISQFSCSMRYNLVPVGVLGFFTVLLANFFAFGFISLMGTKFNHTMTQALPFLALGLGVDDLFLMLHALSHVIDSDKDGKEVVKNLMKEAGVSVTITSTCNFVVFLIACIIPIRALRAFLSSAAVVVFANWLASMAIFPPLFCFWVNKMNRFKPVPEDFVVKPKLADRIFDSVSTGTIGYIAKIVGIVIGLAFMTGLCWYVPQVEMGYEVTDLAKDGTYLARGINGMWNKETGIFYQHSNENIMHGWDLDYPTQQKPMMDLVRQLRESRWSANQVYDVNDVTSLSFLDSMLNNEGICPSPNYRDADNTCPANIFYTEFHKWRKPASTYLDLNEVPRVAVGSLIATQGKGTNRFTYSRGVDNYDANNTLVLAFDQLEINMTKVLESVENQVLMVTELRSIIDSSGLNFFMHGFLYTQIEQFLELEYYFWLITAVSIACLFVICLLLSLSWPGSFLVTAFCLLSTIELYGAVGIPDAGLKFQPLVCISLLMSLGIFVEFVAHPIAAYEAAKGTRDQRLAEMLKSTWQPILYGGFSSFISFLMLGFSLYNYVRKYYFLIFLYIVGIGSINGLFFLPGLLGLLGPADLEEEAEEKAKEKPAKKVDAQEL